MQLNYYVLGQRIQKIRKNKRISQAVLSTMIDKSAGYISYLEGYEPRNFCWHRQCAGGVD